MQELKPRLLFAGADMDVDHTALRELLTRECAQFDIHGVDDRPLLGSHNGITTRDLVMIDPTEIERDAAPRTDTVDRAVRRLDGAHPCLASLRLDDDLVVTGQRSAGQGPGHDGSR